MTEDEFFEFCRVNRDLRIERSAQGELIIMPPTVFETGGQNAEITMQLRQWAKKDGTGMTFDSSTGFTLPNGAVRSPDASWIKKERAKALTKEQRKKFAPICPDFVIELRSKTDTLKDVKEKMREYMENGAQLGFLLDPKTKRVHVYRPGGRVEVLENPKTVAADPVLPGFTLDLTEVW
ncbi:MAG: Uma2 family endonuclease [Acidobacteriota bacterium]|nr:Uma2 family endonuclease [Acidobacteriota bacterium]